MKGKLSTPTGLTDGLSDQAIQHIDAKVEVTELYIHFFSFSRLYISVQLKNIFIQNFSNIWTTEPLSDIPSEIHLHGIHFLFELKEKQI